jgi:hypothetical protein
MRVLISRITVSPSGRLTEPLKWTLVGGIGERAYAAGA